MPSLANEKSGVMRRVRPCAAWLWLLGPLLAGLFAGPVRGQEDEEEGFDDEIVMANKRTRGGIKIEKDTWHGVKFLFSSKVPASSMPFYNIKQVRYGGMPSKWLTNVRQIERRVYTRAIDYFTDKISTIPVQPWRGQYIYYYLGQAHLGRADKGDLKLAIEYYRKLLKKHPDTRFIYQAHREIGEAHAKLGQHDRAIKEIGKAITIMRKCAGQVRNSREMVAHCRRMEYVAELSLARVYEKGKENYREAETRYKRLQDRIAKHADLQAKAWAGIVRCLIMSKDYKAAIRYANIMIDHAEKSGDDSGLSSAYLGLGDAYFEQGVKIQEVNAEQAIDKFMRARYNYLRVIVLYGGDKIDLAYAHYRAARCYEILEPQEADDARRKARRHFQILATRHEKTEFGRKAKEWLNRAGDGG